MLDLLTREESERLKELERVIKRGQKTFVEVGAALAEIKASKLYKFDYDSFEEYCQKRWGWKKSYCYYLIESADAVTSLPPKLSTIVETETQARELAKAPAEDRTAVLESAASKAAAEDRPLTARDIRVAVAESNGAAKQPETATPEASSVTESESEPQETVSYADECDEANVCIADAKRILDYLSGGNIQAALDACEATKTDAANIAKRLRRILKLTHAAHKNQ